MKSNLPGRKAGFFYCETKVSNIKSLPLSRDKKFRLSFIIWEQKQDSFQGGFRMANCSKCGAQLPPNATACEYCGTAVEIPRSPTTGGYNAPSTPGEQPAFKVSSVLTMILLTLFTCGLYVGIWFYMRRDELGRLDETGTKKTTTLINGVIASQAAFVAMAFLATPDSEEASIITLLMLVFCGLLVYASFHIRALLRKRAARISPQSVAFVAPSGFLTFFFTIYYLQIHINRMISARMLDLKV